MKNLIYSFSVLLVGLLMFSCGEDEVVVPDAPAPVANFTFTTEGKAVSFTSTSTDAASYAWDFGDGNTSTDASPTHTYEKNGSFIAKLTVTNTTSSDSKQEVLEIINVLIDGTFDDWSSVSSGLTATDAQGTITSVKFENLENNKLFIYVEGTADLTPLTQIYLDLDNDRSTGAQIDWLYAMGGEDVLIEGNLPVSEEQFGAIYGCAPCDGSSPGNWNWGADPINENIADFIVASEIVSIPGGAAYELVIDLTAMGSTVSSEAIGIGVADVSLDTWGPVGAAPKFFEENDNPEATLFIYEF